MEFVSVFYISITLTNHFSLRIVFLHFFKEQNIIATNFKLKLCKFPSIREMFETLIGRMLVWSISREKLPRVCALIVHNVFVCVFALVILKYSISMFAWDESNGIPRKFFPFPSLQTSQEHHFLFNFCSNLLNSFVVVLFLLSSKCFSFRVAEYNKQSSHVKSI